MMLGSDILCVRSALSLCKTICSLVELFNQLAWYGSLVFFESSVMRGVAMQWHP